MFPHFFDPHELGKTLKEVATDVIKAGEYEVISRWFHSAKDADLFIWLDTKQNIIKQQVTFYGQVVEWNVIEGVRTGMIVEEESGTGRRRKASQIMQFDARAQQAPIEQALKLLEHITGLNDLERQSLKKNFKRPPGQSDLDPAEFVRQFGAFLGSRSVPQEKPSEPWPRRLMAWFKGLFR